jgi:hypothetical protein
LVDYNKHEDRGNKNDFYPNKSVYYKQRMGSFPEHHIRNSKNGALEGIQLNGRILALHANIRLIWECLMVTNATAYYKL